MIYFFESVVFFFKFLLIEANNCSCFVDIKVENPNKRTVFWSDIRFTMSICFLNSTLAYIWKLVMLHLTRQDVLLLLLYIHASGIASVSATGKIKEGKKGDFSGAFTLQGKPKHMEDR